MAIVRIIVLKGVLVTVVVVVAIIVVVVEGGRTGSRSSNRNSYTRNSNSTGNDAPIHVDTPMWSVESNTLAPFMQLPP